MSSLPLAATTTFELAGEIDAATASGVEAELRTALLRGATTVDLSQLEFIDTAGMRAVAVAVRDSGRRVLFLGASDLVRRCWRVARFDRDAPGAQFVD